MKPHEEAVWCEECAHLICVCFLSAAQLDVDYLEWVTSSNTDEVGLTPNMKLSSVATYFKTITSHEEANAALVQSSRSVENLASSPGHPQILSLHGCEIKSGSSLGTRLWRTWSKHQSVVQSRVQVLHWSHTTIAHSPNGCTHASPISSSHQITMIFTSFRDFNTN